MWYGVADTLFEHDHSTFTPAQYMHKIYIFDGGSHKMAECMARVMEYFKTTTAGQQLKRLQLALTLLITLF